jgi:hypothetical protein
LGKDRYVAEQGRDKDERRRALETYRLAVHILVPIVQPMLAALLDGLLDLREGDAGDGVVDVVVGRRQGEESYDGGAQVIVGQVGVGFFELLLVLEEIFWVKGLGSYCGRRGGCRWHHGARNEASWATGCLPDPSRQLGSWSLQVVVRSCLNGYESIMYQSWSSSIGELRLRVLVMFPESPKRQVMSAWRSSDCYLHTGLRRVQVDGASTSCLDNR